MNDKEFISHAHMVFVIQRWAPLVATVSLPFTFGQGPIPAASFVGAVVIAVIWLLSLLFAWRTRSQLLWGLGGGIFFVGSIFVVSHLVGVRGSAVPLSQALQCLCYVEILTGTPLLFFRARLFQFARLDELNVP